MAATAPSGYSWSARGGTNLIKGIFTPRISSTTLTPYKMFGLRHPMIQVLEYAKRIDRWWADKGKKEYEKKKA